MSTIRGRARIATMHGTSAEWQQANPILLNGEMGYDTDQNQFKVGDGTSHWNDLQFLNLPEVVTDYKALTNKPSINGVTLEDNKTSEELKITGGDNAIQFVDAIDTTKAVEGNTYFAPAVTKAFPDITPIMAYPDGANARFVVKIKNQFFYVEVYSSNPHNADIFDIQDGIVTKVDNLFIERLWTLQNGVWVDNKDIHINYSGKLEWYEYLSQVFYGVSGKLIPIEELKQYIVYVDKNNLNYYDYDKSQRYVYKTPADNKYLVDGTPLTFDDFQFEYKTYDATAKKELPNSNFKGLINKLPKPSGEVWEDILTFELQEGTDTIDIPIEFTKPYKKVRMEIYNNISLDDYSRDDYANTSIIGYLCGTGGLSDLVATIYNFAPESGGSYESFAVARGYITAYFNLIFNNTMTCDSNYYIDASAGGVDFSTFRNGGIDLSKVKFLRFLAVDENYKGSQPYQPFVKGLQVIVKGVAQ